MPSPQYPKLVERGSSQEALVVQTLKQDFPASVVVFFVALPLCLGIALASGAPLFSGLIAGIIGGSVVGAISRSPLGVSGPAAGLTVIVLSAIQTLGSFELFLSALVLAGLFQLTLGLLRAGALSDLFPGAVIHGMLSGIGVIIIFKQLPYALGLSLTNDATIDSGSALVLATSAAQWVHPGVIAISLLSAGVLLLWDTRRIAQTPVLRRMPGAVIAVTMATLAQLAFSLVPSLALAPGHLVTVPVSESVGAFLALFVTPDFSQLANPVVWQVAATIAVVASLETLLSMEAIDKIDPLKRTTPSNRELIAQGVGNTCAGLIGGLPVTQVIVRSSVNLQAGAQSRVSTIGHGLLLCVALVGVPSLLNLIPLGVLATVLVLTGYKLTKPALFRHMWQKGLEQFLPFVVTMIGVVFIDLLAGVALGVVTALLSVLLRHTRSSLLVHNLAGDIASERPVLRLELAEQLSFLSKTRIKRALDEVPANSDVILDESKCRHVSAEVEELIEDFSAAASARGITVQRLRRSS